MAQRIRISRGRGLKGLQKPRSRAKFCKRKLLSIEKYNLKLEYYTSINNIRYNQNSNFQEKHWIQNEE